MSDSNPSSSPTTSEASSRSENDPGIQSALRVPSAQRALHPIGSTPVQSRTQIASTVFGKACRSGDLALLKSAFAEFGDDPHFEEDMVRSLDGHLGFAASSGCVDIVSCLLEHGVDPRGSATFALQQKDTGTVIRLFELLIDHGLDLA